MKIGELIHELKMTEGPTQSEEHFNVFKAIVSPLKKRKENWKSLFKFGSFDTI